MSSVSELLERGIKRTEIFFVCNDCGYSMPVSNMPIVDDDIVSCIHCQSIYEFDTVVENSQLQEVYYGR